MHCYDHHVLKLILLFNVLHILNYELEMLLAFTVNVKWLEIAFFLFLFQLGTAIVPLLAFTVKCQMTQNCVFFLYLFQLVTAIVPILRYFEYDSSTLV